MEHSPDHKNCEQLAAPRYNVCQTIDEISFERGIWTAGKQNGGTIVDLDIYSE